VKPREVPGPADQITIELELPAAPDLAFDHFIRSELLTRWWPTEAELDVRVGGGYVFSWPGPGWTLRGRYTRVEQGRALGFTWRWDHEPDMPERIVEISFEPVGEAGEAGEQDATSVTVTQTAFADTPAEQADQQSHRHGWMHFLGRLAETLSEARG
jgi:uncharacterized protein YndB with AHSA1/START domain